MGKIITPLKRKVVHRTPKMKLIQQTHLKLKDNTYDVNLNSFGELTKVSSLVGDQYITFIDQVLLDKKVISQIAPYSDLSPKKVTTRFNYDYSGRTSKITEDFFKGNVTNIKYSKNCSFKEVNGQEIESSCNDIDSKLKMNTYLDESFYLNYSSLGNVTQISNGLSWSYDEEFNINQIKFENYSINRETLDRGHSGFLLESKAGEYEHCGIYLCKVNSQNKLTKYFFTSELGLKAGTNTKDFNPRQKGSFYRINQNEALIEGHFVKFIKIAQRPIGVIVDEHFYPLFTNYKGEVIGALTPDGSQLLFVRNFSDFGEKELISTKDPEEVAKLDNLLIWSFGRMIHSPLEDSANKDLYFSASRTYSVSAKAWTAIDPLLAWSPESLLTSHGNFNPLRYCDNDPVNFVDPSGYSVETFIKNTQKNYESTVNSYKSAAGKAYKAVVGTGIVSKLTEKGMVSTGQAAKSILRPSTGIKMVKGISNGGIPGVGGTTGTLLAAGATVTAKAVAVGTVHAAGILVGSAINAGLEEIDPEIGDAIGFTVNESIADFNALFEILESNF